MGLFFLEIAFFEIVQMYSKIQRINRPRVEFEKKLADSENICVSTYEKGPQVIWLDSSLMWLDSIINVLLLVHTNLFCFKVFYIKYLFFLKEHCVNVFLFFGFVLVFSLEKNLVLLNFELLHL